MSNSHSLCNTSELIIPHGLRRELWGTSSNIDVSQWTYGCQHNYVNLVAFPNSGQKAHNTSRMPWCCMYSGQKKNTAQMSPFFK